jgi:hypothetical protein
VATENKLVAVRKPSPLPLWLLRSGHRPNALDIERNADVALHPSERPATASELHEESGAVLRAIRRRCIDCKFDTCPLHPFRMGKNPNIRLSPGQKAALLRRLQQ